MSSPCFNPNQAFFLNSFVPLATLGYVVAVPALHGGPALLPKLFPLPLPLAAAVAAAETIAG